MVTAVHPQIGFLRHLDAGELPDDFVTAIRRWRSRSGTVKVNLALSELPDFTSHPGTHLQPHHTGAIELAHSLEYLETAFQEARSGQPADAAVQRRLHPLVFDDSLCPAGHARDEPLHAVGAAIVERRAAPGRARGLRRPGGRRLHRAGAQPRAVRSIHRQVIGPYEMEHTYGLIGGNIFHGELSRRPALPQPARRPGYADFRSPIAGLYQAHSATHGGGGVCGIPGWQAARAVLADQRRDGRPWRRRTANRPAQG